MLGDCIITHDVPFEKQLVVEDMCQAPDTPGWLCPDDIHTLVIRRSTITCAVRVRTVIRVKDIPNV